MSENRAELKTLDSKVDIGQSGGHWTLSHGRKALD